MNPVLLALLGLTGVSAAVAARRILQEKRRIHQQWQRQGGNITGPAEGAPEKRGLTASERRAEIEDIARGVAIGQPGTSPQDILQAGGNLEDIQGAIYGEQMYGLQGIGNYEFIRTRRF